MSGQRVRGVFYVLRRSDGAHPPALLAGTRAQINQMVGSQHGLGIVLDHHNRIALPTQPFEHLQELTRITRMQPHRRFVQNIDDPG